MKYFLFLVLITICCFSSSIDTSKLSNVYGKFLTLNSKSLTESFLEKTGLVRKYIYIQATFFDADVTRASSMRFSDLPFLRGMDFTFLFPSSVWLDSETTDKFT